MNGQHHAPTALLPRKTRCRKLGGSQRHEKCHPTGIHSPDRPVSRESLYRLRYPGRLLLEYFYQNTENADDMIRTPAVLIMLPPHKHATWLACAAFTTEQNNEHSRCWCHCLIYRTVSNWWRRFTSKDYTVSDERIGKSSSDIRNDVATFTIRQWQPWVASRGRMADNPNTIWTGTAGMQVSLFHELYTYIIHTAIYTHKLHTHTQ